MPLLAETAGLFTDGTRPVFCQALLDGRAWTAGELARYAGVRPSASTTCVVILPDPLAVFRAQLITPRTTS